MRYEYSIRKLWREVDDDLAWRIHVIIRHAPPSHDHDRNWEDTRRLVGGSLQVHWEGWWSLWGANGLFEWSDSHYEPDGLVAEMQALSNRPPGPLV